MPPSCSSVRREKRRSQVVIEGDLVLTSMVEVKPVILVPLVVEIEDLKTDGLTGRPNLLN